MVINFESFEEIRIFKNIANDLAAKMHCDIHGSCVHFAEEFVIKVYEKDPLLLNKFNVIEGYVITKNGDGIPQQHTWIESLNGEKIDPTFLQFSFYDKNAYYSKRIKKTYTGVEYHDDYKQGSWFADRRLKYPEHYFK